jgi:hypothetical protein
MTQLFDFQMLNSADKNRCQHRPDLLTKTCQQKHPKKPNKKTRKPLKNNTLTLLTKTLTKTADKNR